jgi:hypothetical protein
MFLTDSYSNKFLALQVSFRLEKSFILISFVSIADRKMIFTQQKYV